VPDAFLVRRRGAEGTAYRLVEVGTTSTSLSLIFNWQETLDRER
jgi:hypothetical protein